MLENYNKPSVIIAIVSKMWKIEHKRTHFMLRISNGIHRILITLRMLSRLTYRLEALSEKMLKARRRMRPKMAANAPK